METDEAAMRKAFEEFMISGKNPNNLASPSEKAADGNEAKQQTIRKKVERKYWQILKAFQGTLERDWLQVDDNLQEVMSSIAELRRRIAMESRQLRQAKCKVPTKWQGYGYRSSSLSVGLSLEDLELTLSHDLLQHEKMMAGARMLLSSLSEAQEALGRRLEEMMLHHMDTVKLLEVDPASSLQTVMSVVDGLQEVYASLAMELYRKQLLVQRVLDAVNDDLFEDDQQVEDVNPRQVADKCSAAWPRDSKASHVNVKMLNELLKLGDRGDDVGT